MGAVADLPEDHVLVKTGCFIAITPEEIAKGKEETSTQLAKTFEMMAEQNKVIDGLVKRVNEYEGKPKPEIIPTGEVAPESIEEPKRGPGRPRVTG
jgi:hypothetical protein